MHQHDARPMMPAVQACERAHERAAARAADGLDTGHPTRRPTGNQTGNQTGNTGAVAAGFKAVSTVLFALLALTVAGATDIAPANAQPTTAGSRSTAPLIVLFDSSGSMWGNVPGNSEPKFKLAQSALERELAAVVQTRPSAMVVFGPGCTRAPLTPLAKQSIAELFAPIAKFNPRSKGPLTLGLKTALDALPSADTPGDIVVVHDGNDNCGADPCSLAREMRSTHPHVRLHLLSLALDSSDLSATRCMADLTGGSQHVANDAPSILTAVTDIAARLGRTPADRHSGDLASLDTSTTAGDSDADATGLGAADRTGPSRIRAIVRLGEKGPVLDQPVKWWLKRLDGDSGAGTPVTVTAPQLASRIAPGRYEVTAQLTTMTASTTTDIAQQGATAVELSLDAGRLTLVTQAARFEDGLVVRLAPVATAAGAPASPDDERPDRWITRPPAAMVLAPGTYVLEAQFGGSRETSTIKIAAGSDVQHTPFTDHGLLTIAIGDRQQPFTMTPLTVAIEVDAPENRSGRREIATSVSPDSRKLLRAGPYYLTVTVNGRSSTEQIGIPAGKRITKAFTLQAGRVQPRIRVGSGELSLSPSTPLRYLVYDLQRAGTPQIAWSSDVKPSFHLQPGSYRIVARVGAHNVEAAETVIVKPFETHVLDLEAAVAEIRLALDGASSRLANRRLWEVRTDSGEVVWRTNAVAPSALLAPGTYVVRCFTRNRILEGRFSATAGRAQTVALVAE